MSEKQSVAELIRKVLAGVEMTREEIAFADWDSAPTAGNLQQDAWVALHHWVSDEDIRQRDPEYAEMKREQLQDFLEQIERSRPT